jgi:nitrite reductase (NO-forming)
MWNKLRDWYLAVIGIVVIAGGLYIASHNASNDGSAKEQSKQSESVSSSTEAGKAPRAPDQSQTSPGAEAASTTKAPSAPAASNAPPTPPAAHAASKTPPAAAENETPASHDHPAANPPQTNIAQTPAAAPTPAPASQPGPNAGAMPVPIAGGGDPAAGKLVFRKCQVCHSLEPGKDILGPSLAGIVGRKSGIEPNYAYSPAMKDANLTWDAKTLDTYLDDPQKLVPGNKMPFPGLKTAQDRADVIAFLAAPAGAPTSPPAAAAQPPGAQAQQNAPAPAAVYVPDARYTLRSGIAEGRMVYIGVGGAIDGKVNPVLTAAEGQVVQLTLINGEGAEHDIVFPDQDARSPRVTGKGASTTIAFRATKSGDFVYFCSLPGHRQAGMEGQFTVTPRLAPQTVVEADISREPTDLPPPIGKRDPQTVRVDLLAAEVEGRLAEGTTFGYWTFNGKVPGPFIRVRVGDTVDIHLKNSGDSAMMHSVDFHATTGPGGGAAVLQVEPGKEKAMTWKALVPGLYVYHCATPMIAEHIANGMYGLILVEPAEGLPKVDREFYVMQGEIYTDIAYGQHGSAEFSVEKLLDERPEYFVLNGSVGALSKLHPLHAKVGETVRIFFGVGGPNFTSSFHVIGEIFDRVYVFGGILSKPLEGIQTVSVAPGGAVIVEFKLQVPGNYTIVDHAITRIERGLAGILSVEGPPNPDIFNGQVMSGMGH